ncbi:hypothetical protein CsSME_00011525 [Camellia sinensis var. sinensis]
MSSISLSQSPGPSTLASSTLISLSSLIHSLALESLAFRIVKVTTTHFPQVSIFDFFFMGFCFLLYFLIFFTKITYMPSRIAKVKSTHGRSRWRLASARRPS